MHVSRGALCAALLLLGASSVHAQEAGNLASWLRAGDAQLEGTTPGSLERALEAYAHVLTHPADPDYALALQRTAWVYFLLDRPRESIARFAELVDQLEPHGSRSELRREALDLLGAMFADPDWDRDGAPDASSPLARLTDAALIAQGRPWTAELYFETAHALYLSSRDPEAIALLDHALSRWDVPVDATPMRAACRRHRARAQAMELIGALPATDAVCARLAPEETGAP